MKYYSLFLLGLLMCLNTYQAAAQTSDKDLYEEANILMEDKYYALALPLWDSISKEEPSNANIHYKIGLCYYHADNHHDRAIPHFEIAAKNVATNYDPFSKTEQGAPIESHYFLARVYHLDYKLDAALVEYDKFKTLAGKKHYLVENIDRDIEMCNNAKEIIKSPVNIVATNIGENINTPFAEYSPVISLDEQSLYFTSRRLREDNSNQYWRDATDGLYFEDIYVSHKNQAGEWEKPSLLNINVANDHRASIGLSADGQTLFLYENVDGDGQLFQSDLIGDVWSQPILIGGDNDLTDINSKAYESHVTITSDGKTLYFVSDREGGFGGKDIYRCIKLPNGNWSKAKNLGAQVNTKYDEDSPFIHADGVTLHFSSMGHKSMGGFDVFETVTNDIGEWSSPKNLGYPINSTDDDIFYITSPDGVRAYYSSYHEDGSGHQDIYMLHQPELIQKKLTLLKGVIKSPEAELPNDIFINLTDVESGELISRSKPIQRNGSFVFIIPPGNNYNLSYEKAGKEFFNENIYVPMGSEYSEVSKEIMLDPISTDGAVLIVHEDPIIPQDWVGQIATSEGEKLPKNLILNYVDKTGKVIHSEKIANDGSFKFDKLPYDDAHLMMQIQTDDGTVICQDLDIFMTDKERSPVTIELEAGKDCMYTRSKNLLGSVKFDYLDRDIPTGLKIVYVDDEGNIIYEEKVNKDGSFTFRYLKSTVPYHIELVAADDAAKDICDHVQLLVVNEDNADDIVLSFNGSGGCDFKPGALVKTSVAKGAGTVNKFNFDTYFGYNKTDIGSKAKNFNTFIDQAITAAKTNGTVTISIESSASKVPTKTWTTNQKLAKLRARSAEDQLIAELTKKGLTASQVIVKDVKTLVQGPSYKGDYDTNREAYGKFQYVKLSAY